MLAIRMQRTGRSGHAQFRVIVQDSHFHPTRGKVIAYLGNYNPHTKDVKIDKELAEKFLSNGAQPSDRVAGLLKREGVALPSWVKVSEPKKSSIKNPDKLRKNRPAEQVEAVAETPAEEVAPAVAEAETTLVVEAEAPVEVAEAAPAEPETKPEA